MIEGRGLTVSFAGRAALCNVSFRASAGELVGVVGDAASGKTTLLKTLCLLYQPDQGDVFFDDLCLTKASRTQLAQARARLGFSFQNLALFDAIDVTQNVAFALVRRGVAPEEAHTRALEQLKAVGLAAAVTKMPHELSGGMKRRLALARAMVSRPEVGLFDDPFVGLDPVACSRIARLIRRAHDETGGATVVAAGDPQPLLAVAHRLVLLERGEIAADLPAAEFRPDKNAAVARYLGGEKAA